MKQKNDLFTIDFVDKDYLSSQMKLQHLVSKPRVKSPVPVVVSGRPGYFDVYAIARQGLQKKK